MRVDVGESCEREVLHRRQYDDKSDRDELEPSEASSGKRLRLDTTICGLLAHQTTIIQQLITATRKHPTTSHHQDLVPEFLSLVAKTLSNYMLARVRSEWDVCMVFSASTTCAMRGSDVGEWNVQTCGQTYRCKDFEWSCSCIFNCSYKLPCRHLLYIAECVHRFECLPLSSIPRRWSMEAMSTLELVFSRGVTSLRAVQTRMRERADSFTHDDLT
jgi:hypothetical protein